jgi:Zn-dependent protease
MIPSRWQLLTAAVLLTLVAVGFALLVTESAAGAVVAAAAVWLSLWAHLALHEGAHLVAALAVRIPVVAVRIAPFGGWRNEVLTRPSPEATALPARMAVVCLAGPAANLGTAAVLGVVAAVLPAAPGSAMTRMAMIVAAGVAVLLGLGNLIPGTVPPTDGGKVLRWLFNPAELRVGLDVIGFQEEVSRTLRALDPDPAVTAFIGKCVLGPSHDLVADAERLQAVAYADGTDPAVAASIARTLTVQFGLWYLHAAVVNRAPVEDKEIVELSELARVGFDAEVPAARLAMGLAELLAGRPVEARSLLRGPFPDGLRGVALLLRAGAERQLGNNAEADRLVAGMGPGHDFIKRLDATVR